MTTSAWTAASCKSLGLTITDLAEIGGVTERQAQRWMRGHPLPDDVQSALSDIADDIEIACEMIANRIETGTTEITCYRNNSDLRADVAMPARGNATGGFAGAWMVAAFEAMEDAVYDAELVFLER